MEYRSVSVVDMNSNIESYCSTFFCGLVMVAFVSSLILFLYMDQIGKIGQPNLTLKST